MPERLPETLQQKLSDRLRYYDDIGIGRFYRDRGATLRLDALVTTAASEVMPIIEEPSLPKREPKSTQPVAASAASHKLEPVPVRSGPSLFEAANKIENDTLPLIRENLGDCRRCKLHKTRKNIVFGDDNPKAHLVFVGEGPGADDRAAESGRWKDLAGREGTACRPVGLLVPHGARRRPGRLPLRVRREIGV